MVILCFYFVYYFIVAPDREKRINVLRKDPSKVDYDKNSFLDAFGIKVDPNMATFDGRVLAPPTITAAGPRGDVPVCARFISIVR